MGTDIDASITLWLMSEVGERVKQAREERGWSQKQLADAVGLKQPTIAALEGPKSDGSKHVVEIAIALGVRPQWLALGQMPKRLGDDPGDVVSVSPAKLADSISVALSTLAQRSIASAEWTNVLVAAVQNVLQPAQIGRTNPDTQLPKAPADNPASTPLPGGRDPAAQPTRRTQRRTVGNRGGT